MGEALGLAILLAMGFDGSLSEAMAKAKRAGVYSKYREIFNDIINDTTYLNYLIPLLETQNSRLVAEKIKSSPYGSRMSKLERAVKLVDDEIEQKRKTLRDRERDYQNESQNQIREIEEAGGSGSGLVDILSGNPAVQDFNRQTSKKVRDWNTFTKASRQANKTRFGR